MSFSVNLKHLDGLTRGREVFLKVIFREKQYKTRSMKRKSHIIYGQRFSWPIARKLDKTDILVFKCYRVKQNTLTTLVGTLNLMLGNLITEVFQTFRENLVDEQMKILEAVIEFDIEYISPTIGNDDFGQKAFDVPVFNLRTLKRDNNRVRLPSNDSSDGEDDEYFYGTSNDEKDAGDGDNLSDISLLPERDYKLPRIIDPLSLMVADFQISIAIIEAHGLCGKNLNPQFEVYCGDQKHITELKMQTNTPFYNEYFTFDLKMSRIEMMEQIIRIRAITKRSHIITRHIFSGKVIGEFSIDAKTVYSNENHSFFQKWAVLIDPKAPTSGEKGWVKVDISVLCAGDKPKRPDKSSNEDSQNIEANLLIPQCVSNIQRKTCEMSILIYQAEDLPCMNTNLMSNIKHAILGEGKPLTDAYVEVSFAGFKDRTKVVHGTYSPDWNQQIIFTERFPPYVSRLRIAVRDSDMIKDETISTIFIDLHKIMYAGCKDEEGFLPTFGPSWINLYGTPRTYSYAEMIKGDKGQNQNLAEGVAFRGRLLIAIKTLYQPDSSKIGVDVRPCNPVSDTVAGKRDLYLLFASIFETTLISEEIGKKQKPITFEMSIGTTGIVTDDTSKNVRDKEQDANQYIHSVTEPKMAYTYDNKYFHIPHRDKKPTLYMITQSEDHRPRMLIPNILEKLKLKMSEYIRQSYYIINGGKPAQARRYLKRSINDFAVGIDKVLLAVKSCRGTAKKTLLDVKYQKLIRLDLEKMKTKLKSISLGLSRRNIEDRLRECCNLVKLLNDKILDPQHGLPDIFIYMIQDNVKVAYTRIAAREIFYSVTNSERGFMSGKINTIYLKKMDFTILPRKLNYNIEAQMQIYFWLGHLKDMRGYKMGLPDGYDTESFKEKLPPNYIHYIEEGVFQLRAYLFMGRNLIGSDDSGLSDPFVRIIIGEHIKKSTVFFETRSPMWDEAIIINDIVFNYAPEIVKSSPPNVVVEIFDWDSDNSEEFLGRVFCQPQVFIRGDEYIPPKFQWWEIYRGTLSAGEILAAFDLIEIDSYSKTSDVRDLPTIKDIEDMTEEINKQSIGEKEEQKLRIPYPVRPHLGRYRFEILMWGVRQLHKIEIIPPKRHATIPIKRMGIFPVNQPQIIIDIAGYRIESDKIKDWRIHPNFEDNLIYLDIRLPTNTQFWPPMSIICINRTIFGLKQNVGNHVIIDLVEFYEKDETDNIDIDQTTVSISSEFNINPFSSKNDKEGLIEDAGKKEEKMTNKEGSVRNVDGTAAAPGVPEKVAPYVSKDDLEAADWWTRYYATMADLSDPNKEKEVVELLNESESEDELMGDIFKDIEVETRSEDEEDDVVEIPDDIPKKKKKRKKKKKKKKKKKIKNVFQKDAKEQFLKEIQENLVFENEVVSDNSWIDRIKIYPCELENVKDFGGFQYPYRSFQLYRGKEEDDDYEGCERFGGVFKGNICIYNVDNGAKTDSDENDGDYIGVSDIHLNINENSNKESSEDKDEVDMNVKLNLRLYKSLLDNSTVEFLVRVYVIRAINLHPADINGKADPYLLIRLGSKEIRDRDNYIPKTLNPVFGACFEFEVTFPQESHLVVQVYDWDRLTKDDFIGETSIDLENRWLSPHRGCCGLMPSYHNHGFLKWKDSKLPVSLLKTLCEKHEIAQPAYDKLTDSVQIEGKTYTANTMIEDDDGSQIKSLEPLALKVLQNWEEIVPGNKLVPEHIETRPLYSDDKPCIEQGLLEMWVDMYPATGAIPPPIDISPRKPVGYELRIVILQTEKVRLTDTNFFTKEKSVDIYLKSWVKSTDIDLQKTDVHYRSLSGQGLFNWRFVFKFDYLKAEDSVVYKFKNIYEIDETEFKTPCFLNMQVLDSDLLMSDTIIGKLKFRLSKFPKPAKYYKSCDPFQHSDACAKFNLFKNKKVRGWWPLLYNPKDEDPDEDDGEEIGGTVEMEMELLLIEEAESNPAGLGREEPLPLEKPNRPDGSFLNFLNPWNTIRYFIKYRLKCCLIKLLIALIFVAIIVLFIYNFPGNFSRVIVDKMTGS